MTMHQQANSLEKFLFGALLGGTIGAVLGMLLAPRAGHETREQLVGKMNETYTKSKDTLTSGLGKSKEVVNAKMADAQTVGNQLKQRAEEITGQLAKAGNDAMQTLKKPLNGEQGSACGVGPSTSAQATDEPAMETVAEGGENADTHYTG